MKPTYGPVPSWRLGRSLGIDPVCRLKKVCSFDCLYCQLGRTINKTDKREVFVDEKIIEKEFKKITNKAKADIITLSGTGEPTLAENLGKIIDVVRKNSDLPIAILTNSSLIYRKDVQKDLKKLDIVVAKLDAPNEGLFKRINSPYGNINLNKIIDGIKSFRRQFKGKLALQMMFISENKEYTAEMVGLARQINTDEVQLNTPLRPCPVKPLSKKELSKIKNKFQGLNVVSVYGAVRPEVDIMNMHQTLMRRPEI